MARLTFRRPASASACGFAKQATRPGASATDSASAAFGPGCFESTLDLWRGLDVREDPPAAFWQHAAAMTDRSARQALACAA